MFEIIPGREEGQAPNDVGELKFWTFVPQTLRIDSGNVTVSGWFSFIWIQQIKNEEGGTEPQMWTPPITPGNEPVTLTIPGIFLNGKTVEQISMQDVLQAMAVMFKAPFREIPPVPGALKTNIPPSKRKPKAK